MNGKRWNLLPRIPDQLLSRVPGLSPLMAQLAFNRGLADPSQLEPFLAADERLSADPFLLPDMHQAVSRVYRALLSGENIAVYGDFDADGITATALLVQGLGFLEGRPIPYIPSRLGEGHGLRTGVLRQLREQGISLVITVDCGVTGVVEVQQARRTGLDIVITDHHTPLDEVPPAVAVVDPKLPGSKYPFSELAGVGVAYKLLQALLRSVGQERYLDSLLDLVALGTVADMTPLLSENRYLVKRGLEMLNAAPRLGLREMINQARLTVGSVASENISWVIAPRLNTASRMDHALPSYELLMTESPERAQELAAWLEKKNAERQELTSKATARAREQVEEQGILPLLMVGDESYPAGIAGLVAGRLADEFYRPTVVVGVGRRTSTGSCRSIPEFNIIDALSHCSDLFTRFGGHAQAAGFVMPTRYLPALREKLLETAAIELDGVDLRPRLDIDAEVALSDLAGETYQSIQKLAPFGQGNPLPTFLSRGVEVVECRTMGNNGDHLRFKLKKGDITWDAVGFGMGGDQPKTSALLDVVYNLEIDHWSGQMMLRLNLLDFTVVG
ncbi:MAG TPA: single-stranded-DNA-specific exonuclease RecJ [Dehalococcoidia bacterium]|nr:single-stranded-DNA-specific exonuclease RecJ [Dehalococcoidia bacterium]